MYRAGGFLIFFRCVEDCQLFVANIKTLHERCFKPLVFLAELSVSTLTSCDLRPTREFFADSRRYGCPYAGRVSFVRW